MLADVAERGSTEKRVDYGVTERIRVRVADELLPERYLHAAERDTIAFGKPMHVKSKTNSH
jgi:hypothetical protein